MVLCYAVQQTLHLEEMVGTCPSSGESMRTHCLLGIVNVGMCIDYLSTSSESMVSSCRDVSQPAHQCCHVFHVSHSVTLYCVVFELTKSNSVLSAGAMWYRTAAVHQGMGGISVLRGINVGWLLALDC